MNASRRSERESSSLTARSSALLSAGVMLSIEDLYQSTHTLTELDSSMAISSNTPLSRSVAEKLQPHHNNRSDRHATSLHSHLERGPADVTAHHGDVGSSDDADNEPGAGDNTWGNTDASSPNSTDDQSTLPETNNNSPNTATCASERPFIQISTLAVVAIVMCLGVLLVGFTGFLSIYVVGFREVNAAIDSLQVRAASGAVTAGTEQIERFTHIAALVLAKYVGTNYTINSTDSPEQIMRSLASVLSRQQYSNAVQLFSFTNGDPSNPWRSVVSTLYENQPLAAVIQDSQHPDTMKAYSLDLKSLRPSELLAEHNYSLFEALNSSTSAYQTVALPWNRTLSEGGDVDEARRRLYWTRYQHAQQYAYFDLVSPLRTQDGNLAVLESVIRSTSIMRGVRQSFMGALRENGRYLVVDPVLSQVVVNSWNQSLFELAGEEPYYLPFGLDAIDDSLALATVRELQSLGALSSENTTTQLHWFRHHGEGASVRSHHMRTPSGLHLVFVVVTLESDYLSSVYSTRTMLLLATVSVVILIALAAYWVASYIVTALNQLIPALESSYNLQSAEGTSFHGNYSRFTELLEIQVAYHKLQQQLLALKTFVPGPLLIQTGALEASHRKTANDNLEKEKASGDVATEAAAKEEEKGEGEEEFIGPDPQSRHDVVSANWKQDTQLNTKIFNEQVNVYRPRYCTNIWICRYYTKNVNNFSLGEYFSAAYAATAKYNGCLEFLRPDYVVISFGAHTSMIMHAKRACQCALSLLKSLSPQDRKQVTVLVDSSEYMVGTCGSANGRKGRVMFDSMHMIYLTYVMRGKGYLSTAVATQSTVTHLPDYMSVPIDSVRVPTSRNPYVLCELREPDPDADLALLSHTAKQFRVAFHFMTKGRFHQALRIYESIGPNDPTAARLMSVCADRIQAQITSGYLTSYSHPPLRMLTQLLSNKLVQAFVNMDNAYMMELVQEGNLFAPGPMPPMSTHGSSHDTHRRGNSAYPTFSTTTQRTHVGAAASAAGNSFATSIDPRGRDGNDSAEVYEDRAPREGGADDAMSTYTTAASAATAHGYDDDECDDGCDEALFEWIQVNSATDSEESFTGYPEVAAEGAFPEEPMVFVDDNNCPWTRSVKKISDGAFSVVYLGMSEDGVQVAIKCIPRRRRDIREEDVKTEMRTMALLRHPNIVQYISCCVMNAYLAIIMEYVPGGSLHAVMQSFGRLDVTIARRFLMDILSGLVYLHARGIVHCDVKPHNVLLGVDGVCKLSDFGSTITEASDMARTAVDELVLRGTVLYMAPEVARGERSTPQSDVYSLGISLLEMLLGVLPWRWSATAPRGSTPESLQLLYRNDARFVQCLGRHEVEPDIPDSLDREVLGFVRACCQVDPNKRPSAQELLSFPFVL